MPIDYNNYHPRWTLIRRLILKRANHECEKCYVKNHHIIERMPGTAFFKYIEHDTRREIEMRLAVGWKMTPLLKDMKLTYVVLTIAHLNHDKMMNKFWNLSALCQRCHLLHDMEFHQAKRKETLEKRKLQQQLL